MLPRELVGGLVVCMLLLSLVVRSKKPKIPIWSIMAFAAFIVVVTGLVEVDEIGEVVDIDVILFLVGMFSITSLAESSGLLAYVASRFISAFKTERALIVASSLLFGLLAAVAMNDTVALMGPPVAYTIAKVTRVDPKMMFMLLAFSLTIGSVMTPIGNPQNVLIATRSGLAAPFVKFVLVLAAPTVLNLAVTPVILMKLYKHREGPASRLLLIPQEAIRNKRDAALALVGLVASVTALVVNDLFQLAGLPYIEKRGFIPFVVASAIYVVSSEPRKLLAGVDWGTIVFFISMFIAMEGVWRSGFLEPLFELFLPSKPIVDPQVVVALSLLSILGSQLVSNVPFTKLLILELHRVGYTGAHEVVWLTAAMATTIAGNLTLLGAASNIIIVEYLESRMGTTLSFTEFLKVGAVVTLVNLLIYIPFLLLL